MSGFYSKALLIMNILNNSEYLILILILIMTFLSTFYYIRLIRKIFFKKWNKGILLLQIQKYINILNIYIFLFNVMFLLIFPKFVIIIYILLEKLIILF